MNPRLQILRQARAGSLERAWTLFEGSELASATGDPAALTLKARLIKDRAKRHIGVERMRLFAESGAVYEQAAQIRPASYPLINAASLALLAGREDRSRKLAGDVLALVEDHPEEAETPYWRAATRAEALLLLGDLPGARAAFRSAISAAPRAWEDHAATIGQFELVCAELDCDARWLDQLRPPRSVQFTALMGCDFDDRQVQGQIAGWLEQENAGFGYGAIAAGGDIWIAEALLAKGAELHVVLPCPADIFRSGSVVAVDPAWAPRFDRLIEGATSVTELANSSTLCRASVRLANAVALGLARQNARKLQSEALHLRLGDRTEQAAPAVGGEDVRAATLTAPRQDNLDRLALPGPDEPVCWAKLAGADAPVELPDPAAIWAEIETGEAPVVVDYVAGEDAEDRELVLDRLSTLANFAQEGQVLATQEAAFSLLAGDPSRRVEQLGDLRGRMGQFPFYAVA